MTHPLALTGHVNGFNDGHSFIMAGERIEHLITGKRGVLDEALHDGDAYVTWDDGSFGTTKWNNLRREPVCKDSLHTEKAQRKETE